MDPLEVKIEDLKGTGPSEVNKAFLAQEAKRTADSAVPIDVPLHEFAKALAADVAKAALNLAILNQRIVEQHNKGVEMWNVGRACAQIGSEAAERADDLEREIEALRRHFDDTVRSYESRIDAGMRDNERLKGRIDEERAEVTAANAARARLVKSLEDAEARVQAAVAQFDHADRERAGAVAHALQLVDEKTELRDRIGALEHQLARARDAFGETQLRVDLAHASQERDRLAGEVDALKERLDAALDVERNRR